MQTRRPRFALSAAALPRATLLALGFACTTVGAAGLGSGDSGATLGQALNFAVTVRLDAGETLAPECVAADVAIGERRLAPPLVRTVVEPTSAQTARVRVITQTTVDEPVVAVTLSVGCSNRISRSYVVLADPPGLGPAPAAPSAPPAAATLPAVEPALGVPPSQATPLAPATPSAAGGAAPRVAAPVLTPEQRQARDERRARLRAQRLERQRQAREARASATAANPAPRLQLDFIDPPTRARAPSAAELAASAAVAEALLAAESAASAAREAASAAAASAARVAALEKELAAVRAEAQSGKDLTAQLRQQLAEASASGRWTTPLVVASLLLALLAAWLAWRLGRVQTMQREQWRSAAATAGAAGPMTSASALGLDAPTTREPTSPVPFVSPPTAGPLQRAITGGEPQTVALGGAKSNAKGRGRGNPAWPPPAPPVAWPPPVSTLPPQLAPETVPGFAPDPRTETLPDMPMQRTEALPGGGRSFETAPRDVSIEELIDLEQQAEFFMVLGQDEAAVDLLVEHLRSTGGGSPLPYLKLLEIHQRRGDREAYDRMRERFNHRFNAYAPEWGVDLTSGRSLEDYAGVVPRLQQVWPRPLDAMAELEALLFRKSRGELFDLPAYREVLFLYALARDLLDRAAADTGSVDLLLPMSDGTEAGSTAPAPLETLRGGLERDAFRDTMPPEDLRPTAPLDFDLGGDRPTSIFDLLDAPRTRPPRQG